MYTRVKPDKAEVDAQAAVDASARETDEYAIGHSGPGGVLCRAIEAHLHNRLLSVDSLQARLCRTRTMPWP